MGLHRRRPHGGITAAPGTAGPGDLRTAVAVPRLGAHRGWAGPRARLPPGLDARTCPRDRRRGVDGARTPPSSTSMPACRGPSRRPRSSMPSAAGATRRRPAYQASSLGDHDQLGGAKAMLSASIPLRGALAGGRRPQHQPAHRGSGPITSVSSRSSTRCWRPGRAPVGRDATGREQRGRVTA